MIKYIINVGYHSPLSRHQKRRGQEEGHGTDTGYLLSRERFSCTVTRSGSSPPSARTGERNRAMAGSCNVVFELQRFSVLQIPV